MSTPFVIVLIVATILCWGAYLYKHSWKKTNVLGDGISGKGKILSMNQTGITVSNREVGVKIKLEIHIPNTTPYVVEDSFLVSYIDLHKLEEGKNIPIKVSRENPQEVALAINKQFVSRMEDMHQVHSKKLQTEREETKKKWTEARRSWEETKKAWKERKNK